jgi:hypothetical protein
MQVSGREMYPLNGGAPATQVGETGGRCGSSERPWPLLGGVGAGWRESSGIATRYGR